MKPEDTEIFHKETGEVIHQWNPSWGMRNKYLTKEGSKDTYYYMKAKGDCFSPSNIGIVKEVDQEIIEPENIEHPIFGKYIQIDSRRKYSKAFHIYQTDFSQMSHYGYWHNLILHLSRNTNVLYIRENKKVRLCQDTQDLVQISKGTRSSFYRFYLEASKNKYIAKFSLGGDTYWIINPKFAFNGWQIPKVLYDLFNDPLGLILKKKRKLSHQDVIDFAFDDDNFD